MIVKQNHMQMIVVHSAVIEFEEIKAFMCLSLTFLQTKQ